MDLSLKQKKHYVFILVVIGLIYILLGKLGLTLATINNNVSPVWPASGFSIGMLILFGWRVFPAILVGAFIVNLSTAIPVLVVGMIAIGNTLESIVALYLYNKILKSKDYFGGFFNLIVVICISFLSTIVSAFIGVLSLCMANIVTADQFFESFITWWTGDLMGALLLLPIFLYEKEKNQDSWNLKTIGKHLLVFAVTVYISQFVFLTAEGGGVIFLLFPILLLAVICLKPFFVYLIAIFISCFGIWATSQNFGPFSGIATNNNLIQLQFFLAGFTLTTLAVIYVKRHSSIKLVSVTLIIGWILSGLVFQFFYKSGVKEDQMHFEMISNKIVEQIYDNYEDYKKVLNAGVALFDASTDVNREDWRLFVDGLKLEKTYSGLNGLGFIKKVETQKIKQFEAENRKNGFSDFKIKNVPNSDGLPTDLGDFFIIQYIEPLEKNKAAVGLIASSEISRRVAAQRARDINDAQVTEEVTLVQGAEWEKGFLVFLPVYNKNHKHDTIELRRKHHFGFVYAPVMIENFFSESIKNYTSEVDVSVFTNESLKAESLLFKTKEMNRYDKKIEVILGDQDFYIYIAKNQFFKTNTNLVSAWVGLLGSILTLFISLLVAILYRITEKTQYLVNIQSKKLNETQASLVSAARLSSLGQMAGGVAHEINNPLSIINGRAMQLERMFQENEIDSKKALQLVQNILLTSDRINRIVKSMRIIARDGTRDPMQSASLDYIMNNAFELCSEKLKNNDVVLKREPTPQINILCRESQIGQVLINLINNSYDAVQVLDEKWIEVSYKVGVNELQIIITDSGLGIPPEIAEKLMQPFFTTKDVGKGTGLGLSISRSILKDHSGDLILDTSCKNTRFIIKLPLKMT